MAQNPNPTTNHDLPQPEKGDLDGTWGDTINEELTQRLEERVTIRDVQSELSTYTPYEDAAFWATDTGRLFLGDGTAWNAQSLGTSGDPIPGTSYFEALNAEDSLTDPSGTAHTGELADSSDVSPIQSSSDVDHDSTTGGSDADAHHARYTDEEAEDAVAAILNGGDKISVTYDDANDTLTVDTSALDTEEVEDAVSSLVAADSNLSWSYDDSGDTLTVSLADSISVSTLNAESLLSDLEETTSTSDLSDGEVGFYYVANDDDVIWFDGDTSTN